MMGVVNYAWTEKYPHGDPLLDEAKVKLCLIRGMIILLEKMNRFYQEWIIVYDKDLTLKVIILIAHENGYFILHFSIFNKKKISHFLNGITISRTKRNFNSSSF